MYLFGDLVCLKRRLTEATENSLHQVVRETTHQPRRRRREKLRNMASFSAADDASSWFDKSPSEMSLKELILSCRNTGLETVGFVEKQEYVSLLASYKERVEGQDECPVCLCSLNMSVKSLVLPCSHLLCEQCFFSIVTHEELGLTCLCPLCRAPLHMTAAIAIGMKGAQLTANALYGGGYRPDQREAMFDEAESELRESLRRQPDHVGFLTTLAEIAIDRGDLQEASALCRRAIYFEPDNWYGYATLATVHKENDNPEAALVCFTKSLSLKEDASILSNMVRSPRGGG